jgi:hypothetical protein
LSRTVLAHGPRQNVFAGEANVRRADWFCKDANLTGGESMNDKNSDVDKSTWAIGGGVLLGVGVGFFFLETSALAFVGSILGGLGIGLLITSILSTLKR